MSTGSGAEAPWTIVLIVEDDSDGRVVQELLRPLAIPVRLDWLPANGIGNIRRSGRRLIDLAKDRIGRRGCVAVLIDRDGRGAARQEPHRSIARECRASGVPLILARESLEAWMLADPGISRWLGVPVKGRTDTLRNPKALVAKAFYRTAGRDYARRRGRLQVARQAHGIRRQTSASFDEALRHVEGCLGRGRHRGGDR
jgi:hypothetical protein